ncbi:MAG: hypothetical protein VX989_05175 [Candidatus Neomarinimicrobiota bacterium]|nr:hypothetical protein [Candidatus Neomarinimicrobiota bacterium]
MKYHKSPSLSSINLGVQELINRFKKEKISFDSYLFDSNVIPLKNELNGTGETTNIGNVAEFILENQNQLAGAVLISDGISTEGVSPLNLFLDTKLPVYSLGIGSKNSLIDIFINSIDAPTVAIKNERINVSVDIQSIGKINDQFSVSLYDGSRLIASKYVKLYGRGSSVKANFQYQPKSLGKQTYKIQVSSIEDEVNIINNKQNFDLLILKDKYRIALLTGSPNKNTSIINKSLKNNRIEVDHYIKVSRSKFSKPIKTFWESSYDLIIFDNYPIEPLSANFIRILAKKILSHQSALMLVAGPNQDNASIVGLTPLLGLEHATESENINDVNYWDFNDSKTNMNDLPPLSQILNVNSSQEQSSSIAIFESGWPLLMRNTIGKVRAVTFTASDLNKLFFYRDGYQAFSKIFFDSIDWLIKSGVSSENFFRLNRDYYQQGELAFVAGSKIAPEAKDTSKFSLSVIKNNKILFSKEIEFNIESNRWESQFRTPSPGKYFFQINKVGNNQPIQSTPFTILESKVELNQVYLNEKLLSDISLANSGSYFIWEERERIFDFISEKGKREIKANMIKFKDSITLLSLIIIFLCIEWILRKQKGLI